jgi:hypothetical protein
MIMRKEYRFSSLYIYFPLSLLIAAFVVELTAPDLSGHKLRDLLISAFVIVFTFLLVRFGTHVVLTDEELVHLSYFVIVKRVNVHDITAIEYPATWLSDEMRTLAVIDQSGSVVKMTEMAYGREALADVVGRLSKLNATIKLDEATANLLTEKSKLTHSPAKEIR